MRVFCACSISALVALLGLAAQPLGGSESAAAVSAALREISIDPAQTYRVRNLRLSRGDIKLYLTEGTLAFATPTLGKRLAAVYTTAFAEAGDAEVLVLPPQRSERASLAAFTKSPNLDEHFTSAVFFFSDNTAQEVLAQIEENPQRIPIGESADLAAIADRALRADSLGIDVRLTRALLDNHPASQGFFYGMLCGRTLGSFDLLYEPDGFEPVRVGKVAPAADGTENFETWTSFRPRRAPAFTPQGSRIDDFQVTSEIHPDLSMSSVARFQYTAGEEDGRVVALELAARLRITSARIDGKQAEVFQHESARNTDLSGASTFLAVADAPLVAPEKHQIEVHYEGSVVRRTASGAYFVDERNTWYPFISPMLTTFDLTFRCPENLRLVATGELLDEHVADGIRSVHRKTSVAESLAGFNLGEYDVSNQDRDGYRIEIFSKRNSGAASIADLPEQTADILDYYSKRWNALPIHTLAVSPIEGYFGQGFPGLIYLSSVAYLRPQDRPEALRGQRSNVFFSDLLLPHEIAHQWWGNILTPADYRTAWLVEAMAHDSALEFLENTQGSQTSDAVLAGFRGDLSAKWRGEPVESVGPVDFGDRLLNSYGIEPWTTVIYEKGAWILHMLRCRLGDDAFLVLERRMLQEYRSKPITNDDFRRLAAEFVPAGQPDRALTAFFDTWVSGVGIPKLSIRTAGAATAVMLSGIDDGFIVDVPLRCKLANGASTTRWIRSTPGENSFERGPGVRTCELPAPTDFLFLPGK
jgi:hypothetical protein